MVSKLPARMNAPKPGPIEVVDEVRNNYWIYNNKFYRYQLLLIIMMEKQNWILLKLNVKFMLILLIASITQAVDGVKLLIHVLLEIIWDL